MSQMMRSGVVGGACAMVSLVASVAIVDAVAADDCSDFVCGNNDNKVLICHVPPGNPDNAHTICISPNAVPAHLENHPGDYCGPCADHPSHASHDGDLTGDGVVDSADLLELLLDWGPCPGEAENCPADIDTDGDVGISDLFVMLSNWD